MNPESEEPKTDHGHQKCPDELLHSGIIIIAVVSIFVAAWFGCRGPEFAGIAEKLIEVSVTSAAVLAALSKGGTRGK